MKENLSINEHYNYMIAGARLSSAVCELACAVKAKKCGKKHIAKLSQTVNQLTVLFNISRDAFNAYAAAHGETELAAITDLLEQEALLSAVIDDYESGK